MPVLVFNSFLIYVLLSVNDLLNGHKFAVLSDTLASHYLTIKHMSVFSWMQNLLYRA